MIPPTLSDGGINRPLSAFFITYLIDFISYFPLSVASSELASSLSGSAVKSFNDFADKFQHKILDFIAVFDGVTK